MPQSSATLGHAANEPELEGATVNDLDSLVDWAATLVVASMTWMAGLGAGAPIDPAALSPSGGAAPIMLGWAQAADEPDIQQVGEETGSEADVENLDEGAPADEAATETAETGDAEPAGATEDEDVELLDQGAPPSSAPVALVAEPAPSTSAPASTGDSGTAYVAPAAAPSGPVLPEGFGDGQVHVSTGRGEFPVGLETCEVGAVTGRAYVGLDCDDEGSDAVGHAPTFEDFPFVLEDTFPFDPDSRLLTEENFPFDENTVGFFDSSSEDNGQGDTILVMAGRGTGDPSIGTAEDDGGNGVSLAQRARDRGSRTRAGDDESVETEGGKKRDRGARANDVSAGDDEGVFGADDDSTKATKDKSKKDKSRAKGKKKDRADAKDNGAKKKGKNKGKGRNEGNKKHRNNTSAGKNN